MRTRFRRTGSRCAGLGLGMLALVAAGAIPARAGDGVQFARACDRTYVNKQVGETEQWAVTWEVYGNATGNVLKLDGSPPSFIECFLVGEEGDDEIFDCWGSEACAGPSCGGDQWVLVKSGISVPLSFFLPPGVDPSDPFESCAVGG